MSDVEIADVLRKTRVIACVGASANPARASHRVSQYLTGLGYRVIAVNPGLVGQELFGEKVYASLSDIPEPVDMVDVFRRSEAVGPVIDDALQAFPELQTIWLQLDIFHAQGAAKARARGVTVIENRCPKIEYPRLFGTTPLAEI